MESGLACVALDLDGTTLGPGGVLSPYTREILEKLIARGVHVVVASGRSFTSLPQAVLGIEGVEYAVCSNGATVWHVPTGACIRRTVLAPGAAADILHALAEEKVCFECFIEGRPYADAAYVADPVAHGASAAAIPYIQSTREPVADVKGFILSHADELESLDVVVGDPEKKAALWKLLAGLRDDLYVTSSVPQLLEIAHRNAGKRAGLATVLAGLGLTESQTVAFGDADNDIDMISWAGIGIAMENGTEGAKKAADRIAPPNDEDGVARMLESLFAL